MFKMTAKKKEKEKWQSTKTRNKKNEKKSIRLFSGAICVDFATVSPSPRNLNFNYRGLLKVIHSFYISFDRGCVPKGRAIHCVYLFLLLENGIQQGFPPKHVL